MNSDTTFEVITTGSEDTQRVGAALAKLLSGGEVIELAADLGGGKTTFVQGMAAALDYAGEVTSPTFTLSNIYKTPGGMQLHHYDLYRLGAGDVVAEQMAEELGSPEVVTIIEWAGAADDVLPADRLKVHLEHTGYDDRRLVFEAGGPRSAALLSKLTKSMKELA